MDVCPEMSYGHSKMVVKIEFLIFFSNLKIDRNMNFSTDILLIKVHLTNLLQPFIITYNEVPRLSRY